MKVEGDNYLFSLDVLTEKPRTFYEGSIILFSNPNNPTGSIINRKTIENLLNNLPHDSLLVIDEAFMDLAYKDKSFLRHPDPRLIVLRSLTKAFAVPRLRIGFAYIADKKLAYKIDYHRQPWNINSITAYAFSKILGENMDDVRKYILDSKKTVLRNVNGLEE